MATHDNKASSRVLLLPSTMDDHHLLDESASVTHSHEKTRDAKRALEAALGETTNLGRTKEEFIQVALACTTEARQLVQQQQQQQETVHSCLIAESLLHRAEAAAAGARKLLSDESWVDTTTSEERQLEAAADEYAKRALVYLEKILASSSASAAVVIEKEDDRPTQIGRGGFLVDDEATLSTLGFDNTFQEEEDRPLGSLTSLNEVLDGPNTDLSPISQDGENIEPEQGEECPETDHPSIVPEEPKKDAKKKSGGLKTIMFRRKKATPGLKQKDAAAAMEEDNNDALVVLGTTTNSRHDIQYFSATVVGDQVERTESNDEDDDDAASVKASEDVGKALKTAMDKEGMRGSTVLEGPSRIDPPTFVSAPPLDARVMTAESWDDLADGRSLEDVLSHCDENEKGEETQEEGITWDLGPTEKQRVDEKRKKKKDRRFHLFGRKQNSIRKEKPLLSPTESSTPDRPEEIHVTPTPQDRGNMMYSEPVVEDDNGSFVVGFLDEDDEDSGIVARDSDAAKGMPGLSRTDDSTTPNPSIYMKAGRQKSGEPVLQGDTASAVDTMPDKATPLLSWLRLVTSADNNEQSTTIEKAEFAPVEVGADEAEHTQTALLNREAVAQSIQDEPRKASEVAAEPKRTRSLKNDHAAHFVEASPSFMEQMDRERSDLSERKAGAMRRSRSLFGLLGRRRSRKKKDDDEL